MLYVGLDYPFSYAQCCMWVWIIHFHMPNVVCGSGLSILDSESVFSKAYVLQLNFRRELKLDTSYLNNKIVIQKNASDI